MNKEKSLIVASLLGLSGGIIWVYGAISPMVMALGHAQKISGLWLMRDSNIIILCLVALIFAITGIIGAVKVKSKTAGVMMLTSALGGIILSYTLYGILLMEYFLAFIFLLIGGIIAFIK